MNIFGSCHAIKLNKPKVRPSMKVIKILLILLTVSFNLFAQETVQWASEIMFVTSETTALQFAASQALHAPNVYPKGGVSQNAWRPAKTNHQEYIVV